MTILLYCIAKVDAPAPESMTGVAGAPVVCVRLGSLAAFTSSNPDKSNWLRPQLQTSALEFHRVLNEVFKSTAVIPFRFPTIFDSKEQLIARLQQRASEYTELLAKFRDLMQMEIRVTNSVLQHPSESGTQYLKQRQAATAMIDKITAELRAILSELSRDWQERRSKDGIRIFALVDRNRITDFRNMMLNAAIPRELRVRVSGPWPPSEFMEPRYARIDVHEHDGAR